MRQVSENTLQERGHSGHRLEGREETAHCDTDHRSLQLLQTQLIDQLSLPYFLHIVSPLLECILRLLSQLVHQIPERTLHFVSVSDNAIVGVSQYAKWHLVEGNQ